MGAEGFFVVSDRKFKPECSQIVQIGELAPQLKCFPRASACAWTVTSLGTRIPRGALAFRTLHLSMVQVLAQGSDWACDARII